MKKTLLTFFFCKKTSISLLLTYTLPVNVEQSNIILAEGEDDLETQHHRGQRLVR